MSGPVQPSEFSIKASRGMVWSLAENVGLQLMRFVVSIILARLLLPEQFGLIGMLTFFMALAQSFLDSGFGSALIQKKDANGIDASSVFYFNLTIGVILTLGLWFAAPWIANFYEQTVLISLTRFLSLNIFLNAFRLVPFAILTKRMDFKAIFKISLIAVFFSGSVSIGLALKGFGVWSLAVQSLLDTLIRLILMWIASRWRPERVMNLHSLGTMFSYGSRLLISGLLDTIFNNVYQLFIGKVYSAADLGYYSRAQSMQMVVVQPTGAALGRVIFPALVPFQDDKVRLKQAYNKIMNMAVFLHFPLIVGLIIVAEPLINLLMTTRWASSIPYFQLFCLVSMLWPLHVLNLNILQVTGKSDLFLRLEVAKKSLVVIAIFFTYRYGIQALLWGQVVTSVAAYFLNSRVAGEVLGYSTFQQIREFSPYLIMSLVMGVVIYFLGTQIESDLLKISVQFSAGVLAYIALNMIFKRSILIDLLQFSRNILQAQRA